MSAHCKVATSRSTDLANDYQILDQPGSTTGQPTSKVWATPEPDDHDYGFEARHQKTLISTVSHLLGGMGIWQAIYAPRTGAVPVSASPRPLLNRFHRCLGAPAGLIGSPMSANFELRSPPEFATGLVDCSPNDCPFLTGPTESEHKSTYAKSGHIYTPAVAETSS